MHLGLTIDIKFDFNEHIDYNEHRVVKSCKMIGLLRKFQHILPRHSLLTMYKTFIRPHLDYGDVISGPVKWISKWGGHGRVKSIVGHKKNFRILDALE